MEALAISMTPAFDWQNLNAPLAALMALPFVGLLLAIAILPLLSATRGWWESNRNKLKIAAACALAGVLFFLVATGDMATVGLTYLEYTAFIVMLAALFIISGGIYISGAWAGLPHVNTIFLAIGAILASFLGTTGASMILIRPLLRINRQRHNKTHIVIFFIFIVSNCGGLLTPLGDPPLYLGFLRGVPFVWTLRLLPEWFLTNGLLLALFYALDAWLFRRREAPQRTVLAQATPKAPGGLHIRGWSNCLFLLGVMGSILTAGYVINPWLMRLYGEHAAEIWSKVFQIVCMGLLAGASYRWTAAATRQANAFSFAPILEVAALFFGIFGAMIPALELLAGKSQVLSLHEPWHFFWMTGLMSGFLDNAPTYLVYATLAASQNQISTLHLGELAQLFPDLLAAISCAAVFFGANTYIGNGPNFMVKSIAEHERVKMPSFGGYMLWSGAILIPIFILQTWLFFR